MHDQGLRDIEAELHRFELIRDEWERRLQELTLASGLTHDERTEANTIARAVSLWSLKIRRLRLELGKRRAG